MTLLNGLYMILFGILPGFFKFNYKSITFKCCIIIDSVISSVNLKLSIHYLTNMEVTDSDIFSITLRISQQL